MAGGRSGDDGFAIRDYGYAIGRRQVTDCAAMGTKFWRTIACSRDNGYESGDDGSCIG